MDDRELAALERRVRDSVAGDLRAALAALQGRVSAVYVAAAGDTRHKLSEVVQGTLRRHLVETLEDLARRDYAATRNVLIGAARAGLVGGAQDLGIEVERRLPADVRDALKALTAGMRADLKAALRLARRGGLDRYGDAQAILATARKAVNRADRAAVWVVHRAHNEGRARAIHKLWTTDVDIRMLWRAERDACPACLGFAGAVAEVGEPFRPVFEVADASSRPAGPVMAPPLHPNCLPGDALVLTRSRITAATMRIFEGELVSFRTRGGEQFTATTNHPVLTDHGWVAVGQLAEGQYVLRQRLDPQRPRGADYNDHHVPTSIEQVAKAFLASRGVTSIEVPITAEHFHGDGAGSEIAVVGTYGGLSSPASQIRRNRVFQRRRGMAAGLSGARLLGKFLGGADAPAHGGMGGGGQGLTLLRAGSSHAGEHTGATVARLNTTLQQHATDDPTGDGVVLAERLLAEAGQIELDQVVAIWRNPFAGHVYNLETEDGWYIGNGIITHNCRCALEPFFGPAEADLTDVDLPTALRREAQRSILAGQAQGSVPARLRAADRLADLAGLLVPKTVVKRAKKAVASGNFPA